MEFKPLVSVGITVKQLDCLLQSYLKVSSYVHTAADQVKTMASSNRHIVPRSESSVLPTFVGRLLNCS